jgi:hypothetical protein
MYRPFRSSQKQAVGSLLLSPSPRKKGTHYVLGQVPPSNPAKPAGNWPTVESRSEKHSELSCFVSTVYTCFVAETGRQTNPNETQTNPMRLTLLE